MDSKNHTTMSSKCCSENFVGDADKRQESLHCSLVDSSDILPSDISTILSDKQANVIDPVGFQNMPPETLALVDPPSKSTPDFNGSQLGILKVDYCESFSNSGDLLTKHHASESGQNTFQIDLQASDKDLIENDLEVTSPDSSGRILSLVLNSNSSNWDYHDRVSPRLSPEKCHHSSYTPVHSPRFSPKLSSSHRSRNYSPVQLQNSTQKLANVVMPFSPPYSQFSQLSSDDSCISQSQNACYSDLYLVDNNTLQFSRQSSHCTSEHSPSYSPFSFNEEVSMENSPNCCVPDHSPSGVPIQGSPCSKFPVGDELFASLPSHHGEFIPPHPNLYSPCLSHAPAGKVKSHRNKEALEQMGSRSVDQCAHLSKTHNIYNPTDNEMDEGTYNKTISIYNVSSIPTWEELKNHRRRASEVVLEQEKHRKRHKDLKDVEKNFEKLGPISAYETFVSEDLNTVAAEDDEGVSSSCTCSEESFSDRSSDEDHETSTSAVVISPGVFDPSIKFGRDGFNKLGGLPWAPRSMEELQSTQALPGHYHRASNRDDLSCVTRRANVNPRTALHSKRALLFSSL